MGTALSQLNNRLTFDYNEYLRERDELSSLLRKMSKSAKSHRERQESLQVVHGTAAGLASVLGIAAVAVASPVALPLAAAGHSVAAASLTSSVATYGHGYMVKKDVIHQLENLQCLLDSMIGKDKQVSELIRQQPDDDEKDKETHDILMQAKEQFHKDASLESPMTKTLAAWSILSPGTYSLLQMITKTEKPDERLEEALVRTADAIDKKTTVLRKLKRTRMFRRWVCIAPFKALSRGRLTMIDNDCGGDVKMKVRYRDPANKNNDKQDDESSLWTEKESDSTKVLFLSEAAFDIQVSFFSNGGSKPIHKVDRSNSKQPAWIKTDKGEKLPDIVHLDSGDGVDVVFCLKASFLQDCHVQKAWDFGRHPLTEPRSWEHWPSENLEEDRKKILPDSDERNLDRTMYRTSDHQPCGLDLSCGACFGQPEQHVLEQGA